MPHTRALCHCLLRSYVYLVVSCIHRWHSSIFSHVPHCKYEHISTLISIGWRESLKWQIYPSTPLHLYLLSRSRRPLRSSLGKKTR